MSEFEGRVRSVVAPGPLTADEREELERLRGEVAALRAAPPPPPPPSRRVRWASVGSTVLLVLGLLLVPVSVLAVWTNNQVSNTDRFVATVSPVVQDPAVQAALTDRVTSEILTRLDVQQVANQGVDALAAQGLPPQVVDRLRDLTGPLAQGIQGFVHGKVSEVVASPTFVSAVQRALTVSHQQVQTVLAGDSSAISVSGGYAVLDLAPFIDAAKQQLVASGFAAAARIPEIHPTVQLFPATTLIRAQTAYHVLDVAASWLPWVTLLVLVAGVMAARSRRRATMIAGLGVMGMMLVLAITLLIARGVIVSSVAQQTAAPAAAAYDLIVRFIRVALRTLFVVGLVVALAAYLTGPSASAVAARGTVSRGIASLRRGRVADALQRGPVGPWVHAHRRALQIAAVFLAAIVVVFFLDRPTGLDVLFVVIGLLLVLAIIEFLDQPREPDRPRPGPPPAVGGTGPVVTGAP